MKVKTPISLVEDLLRVAHDVLGTREAFENHPEEVTDDERSEILGRLQAAWFPDDEAEEPKGDESAEVAEGHLKFLQSSGYKVETAEDAKKVIANFSKKNRKSFLADFAEWVKEQQPAQ
jgi:hypothetical protein